MTLSIERARSRRPITWLTLLGILLLPAAVGGILVAALQNPTERLDSMTAAIVNLDEPVTLDGQLTPLGRQLAAGLVEGSDEMDSNLTWVISNEKDAAEGLADGTYQAIVTIPEEFSAAATSSGQAIAGEADGAEQAEITVTTPPDGRVADDLITNQIATVAASTMGTMITEATMDNLLVGFNTIGDQIGDAADGADQLATGAKDAATGAAAIPEGASKLSSGATELSTGASTLAGGLDTISANTREIATGAAQLGTGLTGGAALIDSNVGGLTQLVGALQTATGEASAAAADTAALAAQLGKMAQLCDPAVSGTLCADLATAAAKAGTAATSAGTASGYLNDPKTVAGVAALPGSMSTIATQMREAGTGATTIANGLNQLAGEGIDKSATGARGLATGAGQLATGAGDLATGATELATGLDTLATGTSDLAGGLQTAATSLPSFSDEESTSLSSVVANPVTSNASAGTIFGPTAIPLLAAVVLWFGGLASFIALRAVSSKALTSRRSSPALALRSFAPAAALGAGQGVLVALIVQIVANYDAATWWPFAGIAVLAGVTFAAVNQALVAVLGGIGRWVSALVGVLAVATGLISTVPGWLSGLAAVLPTAPAFTGLIEASGAAAAGLIVWAVLSLGATTLALVLRRTTSTKAVLAAA